MQVEQGRSAPSSEAPLPSTPSPSPTMRWATRARVLWRKGWGAQRLGQGGAEPEGAQRERQHHQHP
eukprot:2684851-Rhodomonas_salina.1